MIFPDTIFIESVRPAQGIRVDPDVRGIVWEIDWNGRNITILGPQDCGNEEELFTAGLKLAEVSAKANRVVHWFRSNQEREFNRRNESLGDLFDIKGIIDDSYNDVKYEQLQGWAKHLLVNITVTKVDVENVVKDLARHAMAAQNLVLLLTPNFFKPENNLLETLKKQSFFPTRVVRNLPAPSSAGIDLSIRGVFYRFTTDKGISGHILGTGIYLTKEIQALNPQIDAALQKTKSLFYERRTSALVYKREIPPLRLRFDNGTEAEQQAMRDEQEKKLRNFFNKIIDNYRLKGVPNAIIEGIIQFYTNNSPVDGRVIQDYLNRLLCHEAAIVHNSFITNCYENGQFQEVYPVQLHGFIIEERKLKANPIGSDREKYIANQHIQRVTSYAEVDERMVQTSIDLHITWLKNFTKAWCKGDLGSLSALRDGSELSSGEMDDIVNEMVVKVQADSVFMIGTLNILGNGDIIDKLRQRNWKIEQV
jgi:hypothetical protein